MIEKELARIDSERQANYKSLHDKASVTQSMITQWRLELKDYIPRPEFDVHVDVVRKLEERVTHIERRGGSGA